MWADRIAHIRQRRWVGHMSLAMFCFFPEARRATKSRDGGMETSCEIHLDANVGMLVSHLADTSLLWRGQSDCFGVAHLLLDTRCGSDELRPCPCTSKGDCGRSRARRWWTLQTNVAAGNLQTCMDLVKQVKPKYSLDFAPRSDETELLTQHLQ